jgi:small subunit ribosomal protein S1
VEAPVAEATVETAEAVETVVEAAPVAEAIVETAKAVETVVEAAPVLEVEEIFEPEQAPELEIVDDFRDNTPHDEFDWSLGKRAQRSYDSGERGRLLEEYEQSLNGLTANEIIQGRISAITAGDVVLDVNYKSDGLVSVSEFRDTPDLKIGDMVDVYVERLEDTNGRLILSRRKAKLLKAWERIVDSFNNGTIIRGTIISKTKGGLIVDAGGLETFLPGSQIDIKPIVDYDQYVGKQMEFKVVKINENIKNAVVSHKALIESDLAEQREQILAGLERGQVLEGIVKNITDFGAFLDLGGVDGLLYITDISWGRVNHPGEVLQLNQRLNVAVLDFDENKKRISLGLKQLIPHPWDVLPEEIVEGSIVSGKIVNIEDYGAFLEIMSGVEGLIHISEVSWGSQNVNAKDYFKIGQEHEAKVVTLDRGDRKMSLSVKQMTNDPWLEVNSKYAVGTEHVGTVRNMTPYGIFLELESGIGGMVHISDISWTKRYNHPSEFTKAGNTHSVVVLECDIENRKISLGIKQLEENPWETLSQTYQIGSFHQGTIKRRDDKGATIQLTEEIEAYAQTKQLRKEDGTTAEVGETLTFKVIEFNQDDKRLVVSHSRYVDDIRREADQKVKELKKAEEKQEQKVIKEVQQKVEKTTLGDSDIFSQLREQFSQDKDKNA